jgi:hypothetical protein
MSGNEPDRQGSLLWTTGPSTTPRRFGARSIELDLALEPDHTGDEAGKLRDGDVATDADIDGVDSLAVPDARPIHNCTLMAHPFC